jgi:hypothetical protein
MSKINGIVCVAENLLIRSQMLYPVEFTRLGGRAETVPSFSKGNANIKLIGRLQSGIFGK